MLFAPLVPGKPRTNQQYESHNGSAVQELTETFFSARKIHHYRAFHTVPSTIL